MRVAPNHLPTYSIDPALVAPFLKSVRLVMTTMTGLTTTANVPDARMLSGGEYDYSGLIGFSGAIVGTVALRFQRASATRIVEAFAKGPIAPDTGDFADALGELTNMVAGAAKREFGAKASISVPSIVMGPDHVIARSSDVPCTSVLCDADGSPFTVELSIRMA